MTKKYKAVLIDKDKCKGCVHCMKKCPTEAIRMRNFKAQIIEERCIGCGECIRVCPNRAKYARYDDFEQLRSFRYKVALPPPSFFGQFPKIDDPARVLDGLKRIGFDDVFEVARGADIATALTKRKFERKEVPQPCISTACPVCVELILMRFQSLRENLLDVLPPVDIAAKLAREEAVKKTGYRPEEIGIFFLSPCPAKVAALKTDFSSRSGVDGVLSVKDACFRLMALHEDFSTETELKASSGGVAWATGGGESGNLTKRRQLAADGIENVISVLRELEDGKLNDIEFVELNACPGGCVGGVLNVENPFVAKSKINLLRKTALKGKKNTTDFLQGEDGIYRYEKKWELIDTFKLDDNFETALSKMVKVEEVLGTLPGLDCGVCGAPSCRAFAEDVVNGEISVTECVRYGK